MLRLYCIYDRLIFQYYMMEFVKTWWSLTGLKKIFRWLQEERNKLNVLLFPAGGACLNVSCLIVSLLSPQRTRWGSTPVRPGTPTWSRASTDSTRCCGCRWASAPWRRPRRTPAWRGRRFDAGWTGSWRATGPPRTSARWAPAPAPSCSAAPSPPGAPPAPTRNPNWACPEKTVGSGSSGSGRRRTDEGRRVCVWYLFI